MKKLEVRDEVICPMAGEGLSWDWKPALPERKAHALLVTRHLTIHKACLPLHLGT